MARCATAFWQRSARRSGTCRRRWLPGFAELEGRDITLTGQAIVNAQFDNPPTNPLRKPDGSVMTLIVLAGSTASAVDSYILATQVPRSRDRSEGARHVLVHAGPDLSPPRWRRWPSYRARPAQRHRVYRAVTGTPECSRRSSPSSSPKRAPRVSGSATASSTPSRWASTSRRGKRFAGHPTALPRASG